MSETTGIRFRFPRTVQRIPYLGVVENAHVRESIQYGEPEAVLAAFAPASSTEPRAYGQMTVITPATLYLDHCRDDLSPHDKWVVDGEEYEVEGTPKVWRSPFTGWEAGTEIALRRADG